MRCALSDIAIQLTSTDNIAIAKREIPAGSLLESPSGPPVPVRDTVPQGHKFALQPIPQGAPVRRNGFSIGIATRAIERGEWVHSHNLAVGPMRQSYSFDVVEPLPTRNTTDTFLGYRRPNGSVGTRNYVALISTVDCSAHVTSRIARAFTPDKLSAFPNVDGVIPILHAGGCSLVPGGLTYRFLTACLANVAANPNIGATLYVGLGCEVNQVSNYVQPASGGSGGGSDSSSAERRALVIQDEGGSRRAIAAGIAAVEALLAQVNAVERSPQPVSALRVALQCGGSDSWSGITANPLVGRIADRVVAEGGTAVLCETPEIFGAEDLLTRRVANADVGRKLIERFQWWNEQSAVMGFTVDNNPTPGNKVGGLTTIFEKSLGAVAKGGTSPVTAVYEYAERVTAHGLVFMDTPGNDTVSMTGQLAGGCNVILFTTGRGNVLGSNIAPCIKVSSHTTLARRMPDDIDYDAGRVLDELPMSIASDELYALLLHTASGSRSKSEENGLADCEFVPWHLGPTL